MPYNKSSLSGSNLRGIFEGENHIFYLNGRLRTLFGKEMKKVERKWFNIVLGKKVSQRIWVVIY